MYKKSVDHEISITSVKKYQVNMSEYPVILQQTTKLTVSPLQYKVYSAALV